MRRVISLYLPHWSSDRLRRARREFAARDKPLVTAMMQGQRRILASVDDAAARLGLSVGMTVTHTQSLISDLTVVEATLEEDEAALFRLALWCIEYSPLVTPDPPDGVFIDVAGSAHLFQGEAALLQDLCRRLGAEGITAKAALADTAGCAWAMALTCRVRRGFSCARKKSKPSPNCPIIRRGFSSGAARATALLKPMGRSASMANGGGATAKRN